MAEVDDTAILQGVDQLAMKAQQVDQNTLQQQLAAVNQSLADAQNALAALQAKYDDLLTTMQQKLEAAGITFDAPATPTPAPEPAQEVHA